MSAIVGVYWTDGRRGDPLALQHMVESVAHRGADAAGIWNGDGVGLGHRMLCSTPESLHERLPLAKELADLAITADARLDNRDELIRLLGLAGRPAGEMADSELILAAYERWGEECPEKLLGDFAFVIWDGRRQRLFCARDPMGIRPLYYSRSSQLFAFGSEIKALLALPEIPRRLNEVMIASYLAKAIDDATITIYRDISRLPGGHCLMVRADGVRLRRYWTPDLSSELRFRSDAEYAEALRDQFTEAVRCRLRSVPRVGSLLSGGLDSSSIACTARNLLGANAPLPTFSAVFRDLPPEALRLIDEQPYIDAVLATGGFEPHAVRADQCSPLLDLDRVFWHADEPVLGPNLYISWLLYRTAEEHGVRVLLEGVDGDSTISHGYEYLTELARTGRWRCLLNETSALARKFGSSRRRLVWNAGFRPLVPQSIISLYRTMRGHSEPEWGSGSTVNPEFARRVGLAHHLRSTRIPFGCTARTVREQHWRGLSSGLFAYVLELSNKIAAAFGLELRYPFFDRRLIEFSLRVPPAQRLHLGSTRWIMRRAMEGVLPAEVQWRATKANLGVSFKQNLLRYEQSTLDQLILARPDYIEEYVDMPALRAAYHRYRTQPAEQDAFAIYQAVILSQWLRQAPQRTQPNATPPAPSYAISRV